MRETRVQSLGREDPLEQEMATHSRILAWRIPWTEEPGRLQSMGLQRVGHNLATKHMAQVLLGVKNPELVREEICIIGYQICGNLLQRM